MKIYREVKGLPEEDGSGENAENESKEEKVSFDVVIGEVTDTAEAEKETEAAPEKNIEE
mgnify:CR=1 FL=1